MRCKNCNSQDIRFWKFNLYGIKGYKVHCVHCGHEYFRSNKEMVKYLKEDYNEADKCNTQHKSK